MKMDNLTPFTSKQGDSRLDFNRVKHGQVGWALTEDGDRVEVIFSVFGNQIGWISADEFRKLKQERKANNIIYYASHPHILSEKISLKRKKGRGEYVRDQWRSSLTLT